MFFPTYLTSNSYLNQETLSKHLIIDIMKKQIFFYAIPVLLLVGLLFLNTPQERAFNELPENPETEQAFTFPCAFCDAELAACIAGGSFTEQECQEMMASCYAECQP